VLHNTVQKHAIRSQVSALIRAQSPKVQPHNFRGSSIANADTRPTDRGQKFKAKAEANFTKSTLRPKFRHGDHFGLEAITGCSQCQQNVMHAKSFTWSEWSMIRSVICECSLPTVYSVTLKL